jgi:histidyl-tRNA synthetase
MGDVVLGEILEQTRLYPAYSRNIDYFLVRVSENELPILLRTARFLRKKGSVVEFAYNSPSLKKPMARPSKVGAKKVLTFAEEEIAEGKVTEEEIAEGKVTEKDLSTGEESKITIPNT